MSLTFLDNILSDTITEEEYLKERRARSHSSASVVQGVITNVKLFCSSEWNTDFYMVLAELKKDADETHNFRKSLVFFQKFVNWLHTSHPELQVPANHFGHFQPYKPKCVASIRNYVGQLRLYLKKVGGIEISSEQLDDNITLPAQGEVEEAEPLTHNEFRHIVTNMRNQKRRMLYLIKKDTCSRIGAMVQLRRENFDVTIRPIVVTFPAHIMKKNKRGESRTVRKYVTTEPEYELLRLLEYF